MSKSSRQPNLLIGTLLAGGKGRRFGYRDKAQIELNGRVLYEYALDKLAKQTDDVVVVSSERPDWMGQDLKVKWVKDVMPGGQSIGPVGGILAALSDAVEQYGWDVRVLTAPVDAPFFPRSLGDKLIAALDAGGPIAIARCGDRLHPTFGVWSGAALGDLKALVSSGERALYRIAKSIGSVEVVFDDPDAFLNINTPEDLERAKAFVVN